jgi:flagellar basal body rod protein FlgG
VVQGYLESSNANISQLMTQMVEVGRSYEAAQKLVQNQDELLGKTIASLGRIG